MSNRSRIALLAIVGVAVVAAALLVWRSRTGLPAPGSDAYEQVTRAFYRGLASLDVGLLDDAKREFTAVTTQVEKEPAGWANLGLAHLRLGQLDEAAAPIERAVSLAPENADLVALAGRMEIARGRLDEGLGHLRRAAELAPQALRTRFALAEEVERAGAPDADAQALALLDELVMLAPQNTALLVERARVAAKAMDQQRLNDSIMKIEPIARGWPATAVEQYRALRQAVASSDVVGAQRATAFLRNVLARVPSFGEDLAAVRTPTELIAEPIHGFLALTPAQPNPDAADMTVRFEPEPLGPSTSNGSILLLVPDAEDGVPAIYEMAAGAALRRISDGQVVGSFPVNPDGPSPSANSALSVDWDNDFRSDVILSGSAGVNIFLQTPQGTFTPGPVHRSPCYEVWAADVEMDGDLDLVCRSLDRALLLRNNGNLTITSMSIFGQTHVDDFAWGDVDGDADPDAVLVDAGRIRVFVNRQAGDFVADSRGLPSNIAAVTIADVNADGIFDIVTLDQEGGIQRTWLDGERWNSAAIGKWDGVGQVAKSRRRLMTADLDNNGAVDLIATGGSGNEPGRSRAWLADERYEFHETSNPPTGQVFAVADLNRDGRLDLASITEGEPVRLVNRGTATYHWKAVRPRGQATAGDQRINSFGLGGYLEARADLLFQKQLLTGGPVHIGLGTRSAIDVLRIVWPNGIPQAEFGLNVDDTIVVEQRLKGSCPWVFTWDGRRMIFVTDFLWRSPLGLRINAQDTAGVTQTEDWVRLRGDQLVPRDGNYDVRITAELWETHFFDHVSLMAVDHPDGTEVFVDERFSPTSPPAYAVHVLTDVRPVPGAWDHRGADVARTIAARDGTYLSTFKKGRYQGIAENHHVEIDPGPIADGSVLVATGWIYPTDSSINVAISQAGIAPRGLSLEAQNADGSWRVVDDALGFPAGKNKTLVIDLKGAVGARRVRLSTNLEIYWDALQLGSRTTALPRTTRVDASAAELRYRGFSHTSSMRGDAPETPEYDRVATTSPRWRDLTGYHTRFGDVRELVERVDDRYVIVNAGDELRLQFPEVPPAASGWRRDFVLIGDGWEKDGDYNTGFSQTVLPLPSHDRPAYGAGTTSLELEDDPVYRRHRADWERFHTRYVTPNRFLSGLAPR